MCLSCSISHDLCLADYFRLVLFNMFLCSYFLYIGRCHLEAYQIRSILGRDHFISAAVYWVVSFSDHLLKVDVIFTNRQKPALAESSKQGG